jgi:RimJ/RimL family protein N-acetyltransferase
VKEPRDYIWGGHRVYLGLETIPWLTTVMKPERITRWDKTGEPFEIGIGCAEDFPALLEMYRIFYPKPASQGLPPEDPEICHSWVKNLFEIGKNFLAWRGDTVIGHAALALDIKSKSGEFVIFVNQHHRNVGIGTELTRITLEKAREFDFDSIWLTVNLMNFIAIKLYRKFGFQFRDMDRDERIMSVKLRMEPPGK